ncbi:MAG TPA: HAD-IIIA family hydrolase, partial [Chitinophagaceae bacterium]|nr:HAD-IIIA family hydrolase [Chitinophagaceae bacterium]
VGGVRDDGYFIDIGVPQDYRQAQADLARPPLDLARVDKGWTLLLDRDGVINREIQGGYVRNWEEFAFLEGARDAIRLLAGRAGRLLVVSNQRGIGKGLMTDQDLSAIHARMVHQIREAGGRIDGIYYCSSLDDRHPDRKPNPGMAFRARHDFPGMDLSRTIMVGNKPSDMLFGRNAGVYTVFIRTTNPDHPVDHADIDLAFDSLLSFAKAL